MSDKDAGIDIERILDFAEKASRDFKSAYTELKFAGYLTWLGGLLIFLTFILSALGRLGPDIHSQVLFVSGGVFLMLLGGSFLALQTMLTFRLEVQSQQFMFETAKLKHELQLKAFDAPPEPKTERPRREFPNG